MKKISIPKPVIKNAICIIIVMATIFVLVVRIREKDFEMADKDLQIVDIANNDVSKKYTAQLIKHYQNIYSVYEQPKEPIRIHAATAFQGGALLLISPHDIYGIPQLIYLDKDRIMVTSHYPWATFNYTYLMGHTIYYGLMYPGLDNLEISRGFAYGIDATFTNGETQHHECAPIPYINRTLGGSAAPNGSYAGGYIFVNEGPVWLDKVVFYDSDGNIDIDTTGIVNTPYYNWIVEQSKDIYQIKDNRKAFETARASIKDTVERLDLNPLMMETSYMPFTYSNGEESLTTYTVLWLDAQDCIMNLKCYLYNENFDLRFMYMQNDALEGLEGLEGLEYRFMKANSGVKYRIFDTSYRSNIDELSSTMDMGKLIAEVENEDVYWLNLSQIKYRDEEIESHVIKSSKVPAEEGIYCVYIIYDGWYHFAVVEVVK